MQSFFCIFIPLEKTIYDTILEAKANKQKCIALLIDPDDVSVEGCKELALKAEEVGVKYLFVGGSLLTTDKLESVVKVLKSTSNIPIVLFPGNNNHVTPVADGILFLSLISGRNADFLIGQQVISAPSIKQSGLEVLPTGYILIDSGVPTTVSYMSNTKPIPADKPEIAACTALAGEMLGLKLFYLEGGSGAKNPVSIKTIEATRKAIDAPIIVGGGLNSKEKIQHAFNAGADIVVVGTAVEKDYSFLNKFKDI